MQLYQEGEQILSVDDDWTVVKIDDHPYYKSVSGRGLKSVDFVLFHPVWGVALIELKDYDKQPLRQVATKELEETLLKKQNDTVQLLLAINKMLRRKWHYKLLIRINPSYSFIPVKSRIWLQVGDMLKEGRYITINEIRHA